MFPDKLLSGHFLIAFSGFDLHYKMSLWESPVMFFDFCWSLASLNYCGFPVPTNTPRPPVHELFSTFQWSLLKCLGSSWGQDSVPPLSPTIPLLYLKFVHLRKHLQIPYPAKNLPHSLSISEIETPFLLPQAFSVSYCVPHLVLLLNFCSCLFYTWAS